VMDVVAAPFFSFLAIKIVALAHKDKSISVLSSKRLSGKN